MAAISGYLITVRTAKQGAAMEMGKHTPEYRAETATLTLSPGDLQALALPQGRQALLSSDWGEAAVTCRAAEGPDGVFFLPLGPTANLLIGEETGGTGVPSYKGLPVRLRAAEKNCGRRE